MAGSYMQDPEYLENIQEFKDADAILRGHFILSSGLHSDTYIQCARIFISPARAEKLCKRLAIQIQNWMQGSNQAIDAIVSPAMGGVVVGYEMGRQLAIPTMFCERVDGSFTLRRGFTLEKEQRVLIVEDVVTTGKSTMETARCIASYGAVPVAVASLIDRTGEFGNTLSHDGITLPFIPLVRVTAYTYKPDELPEHLKAIPAIKPGSRFLKAS